MRLIDKEVDILGIVNINGFLRREIFTKLTLCLFFVISLDSDNNRQRNYHKGRKSDYEEKDRQTAGDNKILDDLREQEAEKLGKDKIQNCEYLASADKTGGIDSGFSRCALETEKEKRETGESESFSDFSVIYIICETEKIIDYGNCKVEKVKITQ